MDAHQHVHDLLGAYALDAVTPEEAALVEQHLLGCARCRAELGELNAVVDRLPDLVGEAAPPARLKERIMAAIVVEEEQPATSVPVTALRPVRPSVAAGSPWSRASRWNTAPLLGLAAMLTLLLVSVTLWRLYGNQPSRPTATYAMGGTALQPAVSGSLAYYGAAQRLELDVHGLKQLSAGRVYELWLIRGHYRLVRAVGSFRPGGDGHATLAVQGQEAPGYTMACLTVEAGPGARRPTLPLVAIAPITH